MASVKAYGRLREVLGREPIQVRARTVGQLIKNLEREHGPGLADKLKGAAVIVNGRNAATLLGPLTGLDDHAEVHLFPPMGGG